MDLQPDHSISPFRHRFDGAFSVTDNISIEFGKQARSQISRVKSVFSIVTPAIAEPVIHDVIARTDLILHEMIEPEFDGNALVFVGLNPNPNSKWFKNYRTIELTDLKHFVETGELRIPDPTDLFVDKTAIQDLDAKELTKQLDTTIPPVEMFTDIELFKQAEAMIESVSAQGRARNARRELEDRIATLVERRKHLTDRYELNSINTEIRKQNTEYGKIVKRIFSTNTPGSKKVVPSVEPLVQILPNRPDLQGLSLVMGRECHMLEADAKTLDVVSKTAGRALARFDVFGSRDFFKHNENRLKIVKALIRKAANSSNAEQALSTLDQMLQMEQPAVRLELVKVLRENNSPTAIGLLSCYAKYDLESSVRIAATDALRGFPADAYRASLLDGLTYPWPAVAKNAAEALIRLNDTDAVPQLVELLDHPDPRTPKQTEDGRYVQRELVAINHMRNCMLCHADSQSESDLGRGLIPVWGKPLARKYYNASNGAMVRADVTYLRQDFSVIQKVKDPAPWPEFQRFDYVVRGKLLSQEEYHAELNKFESQANVYHAVIAKTLRMLTNEDPGDDSYEIWKALVGE